MKTTTLSRLAGMVMAELTACSKIVLSVAADVSRREFSFETGRKNVPTHVGGYLLNGRLNAERTLKLAAVPAGRIVLHMLCACRDHRFSWHWRGVARELAA